MSPFVYKKIVKQHVPNFKGPKPNIWKLFKKNIAINIEKCPLSSCHTDHILHTKVTWLHHKNKDIFGIHNMLSAWNMNLWVMSADNKFSAGKKSKCKSVVKFFQWKSVKKFNLPNLPLRVTRHRRSIESMSHSTNFSIPTFLEIQYC